METQTSRPSSSEGGRSSFLRRGVLVGPASIDRMGMLQSAKGKRQKQEK